MGTRKAKSHTVNSFLSQFVLGEVELLIMQTAGRTGSQAATLTLAASGLQEKQRPGNSSYHFPGS